MAAIRNLLAGAARLGIKYVVLPFAITAATAFVLGGIMERVRREKMHPEIQSHLKV